MYVCSIPFFSTLGIQESSSSLIDGSQVSVNYNTMTEFRFYPGEQGDKTTACADFDIM